MGTSKSSSGSPSGVPMVPPWVPDILTDIPDIGISPNEEELPPGGPAPPDDGEMPARPDVPYNLEPAAPGLPQTVPDQPMPTTAAPRGRFGPARRNLGNFIRTGNRDSLKKSLGGYVRKGYGGAHTAMRRMGKTISVAGALYGALSNLGTDDPTRRGTPIDPDLLRGKSASQIMDAVTQTVCSSDGTQDADASKESVNRALAELLTQYPNADTNQLTEEQKAFAVEKFIANDIFQRFTLDVGKTLIDKCSTHTEAATRFKEVRDFIKQKVGREFRRLKEASQVLSTGRVTSVVAAALFQTFQVFESYL